MHFPLYVIEQVGQVATRINTLYLLSCTFPQGGAFIVFSVSDVDDYLATIKALTLQVDEL